MLSVKLLLMNKPSLSIISAEPLTSSEEGEVLAALQANPDNTGKQFQLEFTVDESIQGGL